MHRHSPVWNRVALSLWLALSSVVSWAASREEQIRVSFLQNQALYRVTEEAPWQNLSLGTPLQAGAEVKTLLETRLVLQLGDGSEVRIAPNSLLRINTQTNPLESHYDFELSVGRAWAKLRKNVTRAGHLILRTTQATIDIQGTAYEVMTDATMTDVHVFSGKVAISGVEPSLAQPQEAGEIAGPTEIAPPQEVSLAEWHVIVGAFQRFSVSAKQRSAPTAFTLQEVNNPWVSWNLERDR